jgi:hypothetical protein
MMRALPLLALLLACTESTAVKESLAPTPTIGVPLPDGGADAGSDCFTNPRTHFEIINACTTATKITKNPTLARLAPDGGLPPLP